MQKWYKFLVYIFFITLLSTVNFYSQNLITNGDFGTFNAAVLSPPPLGYITTYSQMPYNNGTSIAAGKYAITNNPKFLSPTVLISSYDISNGNFGDGTGNMMFVKGKNNDVFWELNQPGLTLTVGQTYLFSFWIKNVHANTSAIAPPPIIDLKVSGIKVGTYSPVATDPLFPKPWVKCNYSFVAATTSITIQLSTFNAISFGEIFVIDDISLTPPIVPMTASFVKTDPSCPTVSDGSIVAYTNSGISSFAFELTNLAGTFKVNNSTGVFTGLSPDSYTVSVVDSDTPPAKVTSSTLNLVAPTDMTLSSTASGCVASNSSVTLTASNGVVPYTWSASSAVPIVSTGNIVSVTPAINTTYTVTSLRTIPNTNLITNGGFESGKDGFYSEFVYTVLSASLTQFDYGIVTNPNSWNPNFITSTARTGTKMFVAKGATVPNKTIWSQTVLVDNSKTYTFEFYAQNVVPTSPATFRVLINGVQIISPISAANSGTPGWTKITGTWNSGTATTAQIQIINTNISLAGNDFAIDDVSFSTVSPPKSCLLTKSITVNISPVLSITNPPGVCLPATVDITLPSVTAGSTGGVITYWSDAAATIPLSNPFTITTSGTYYIKSTSGICSDIKPVIIKITTTPVLSITNPAAVCSPATVDITFPPITAGSTPGTLSYWLDDQAINPLPNPYTISFVGTYYIKNTVNSCFIIKPVTVTIINSGSIAAPTVSTPVIYCQNSVASSLTATPASAGATLNWYGTNAAGGTATSTAPIPSTSTVGQSIYYVSQTIGTCESPRVAIVVTISAPPSAGTLSGTQNVCVGLTTVFTSSVAGGVWRSIDTSIATVNSVNGDIRGISTGITEINYLVEGTDVCDSVSATRTVTVAGPPVAGTLNGNQNVCVGLTTVFTSTVSGGTWSSSNNAIATVNSATGLVTGISGGAAIITYTAVGTGSCDRFTATRTITVKPNTLTSESSNATLCVNSILTNITHTTSGASGIGIPTGLPAGVSASFTNNTITIKGTPIVAGTFKYSIPLIGCGTSNATGLINVTTLGNLSLTSPSTTPIGFFDTVTLNVQLSEATDLYGLYMKVKGNAAVSQYLDYQGFTASTLLGSGSNVISTPPTVTNGVFDFGITKVGPSSGYSGSGLYYTLSFTPKNISIPDGTDFCFFIDNISAYNSSGISCSLTNQGQYCYTFTNKVNVWPGDLNKSKTVTTADILPIGYFYNSTGPARSNATIQWTAQPITPWGYNRSTQNGDAYKVFADSNGDGVITNADQAAIGFNMTKVHSKSANTKPFAISPKVEQTTLAGGALVVTSNTNVINTTNLPQTVTFTVTLNNTGGLDALYGISVNLIFDDTIFDLSTASIDYTGSIFGKTGSDCLILNYNSLNAISVGLTRYANAAINGQGLLFKVTLSTKLPVVSSLSETQVTAYADTANNQAGDILVVQDAPVTTIVIKNNLGVDTNRADEFVLYPNPVNDILYLSTGKSTDQLENLKLIVFNTLGQIVNEIPVKNSNMKISTRNWGASGVYFVKIVDDANYIMSVRKIILR